MLCMINCESIPGRTAQQFYDEESLKKAVANFFKKKDMA